MKHICISVFCLAQLLLVSCILPDSSHKPSKFYLLNFNGLDSNFSDASAPSFYVMEVRLSRYLEDNRMVFRPNDEIIEFCELDRWGEPLSLGMSRLISQILSHQLGSLNYGFFPHRRKMDFEHEVEITVERFEKISVNQVRLKAFWEIKSPDNRLERKVFDQEFQIEGEGKREEVKALVLAVSALSEKIAEKMRSSSI